MKATASDSTQASENADFATETLRGDVRDSLITLVKGMETPWSKLTERDQAWRIEAIDKLAQKVVRQSTVIVSNHGFPQLEVQLSNKGKFGAGSLEMTIDAAFTVENATKLTEHGSGRAILVLAEAGEFFGERRAAMAEPNQRAMDLDAEDAAGVPEMDLASRNAAMIRNASSLAGLTIDLGQFPPDQRAELAERITAVGGRFFESDATGADEAPAPESEKPSRPRRRAASVNNATGSTRATVAA